MRLLSTVPHANEVEGTGEHASFKDAEQESGREQGSIVPDEALAHGHKPKATHADAEPDTRLHLLQQKIRGDLEEDVWDEEDDKRCVVAVGVELQLLGEAEDIGIGDVDAASCEPGDREGARAQGTRRVPTGRGRLADT